MVTIIVTPPGPMTGVLFRTLSDCCRVLSVTLERVSPVHAPDVLLLEADVPPSCTGDTVYVLGAAPPPDYPFTPDEHALAVVHSENREALAFAAAHHLKTLTCGLSVRDTLTLSSLTDECAMVCLQREIRPFGGGIIEPGEIPVRLYAPVGRGELLLVAAVLLLCGGGAMGNA